MTTAPAPALGYSIVANLGGDRQITVQCFVGEDEPLSTINAKLDRALAVVDRQKARYEIDEIREDLSKHEKTYAQFVEDAERIELDYQQSQKGLNDEIEKLAALHDETRDAGYQAHVSSGRRGGFAPSGHLKQQLSAINGQKLQLAEARDKNTAERDAAISQLAISKARYEAEIDRLKTKIAAVEAKIGD